MLEAILHSEEPVVPEDKKQISISASVVAYNNNVQLDELLSSISTVCQDVNLELFVINNGSFGCCDEVCEKYSFTTLIESDKNVGFGAAHNKILSLIASKYHFIINPDIVFEVNTIRKMIEYMDGATDVVMATCEVLNPDHTIQHLPKRNPRLKYLVARRLVRRFNANFAQSVADEYTMKDNHSEVLDLEFCTGCFFVIRTDTLKSLHGFDEKFFMYFEDADITRRALQYGKVKLVRRSYVVHAWNRGSSKNFRLLMIHIKSMISYFKKYGWR